MLISTNAEVDRFIAMYAAVAIGVSGGKDSQAAAIATIAYLDSVGHKGPRVLIHADLGMVEWDESLSVCEKLAKHLGCDLIVVRRKAGGLMERWESRWMSSKNRYETLSTVTLVPCWSTPGMRFCTSELKTHVITAELKRRYKGLPIINVTGVRREESPNRAKMPVSDMDKGGLIINWRPIIDMTTVEVFALIDSTGLLPHPAYREYGMGRVSCMFCIMSNIGDMIAASKQPQTLNLYRRMVQLEIDSGFAFQGARWLGDLAPHNLSDLMREAHQRAKEKAAKRVSIEKMITKPMLYVKGWPTRMLDYDERVILCDVRNQVSQLYGFNSLYLTVDSIQQRYEDLLEEKARKEAA